MEQHSRWSSVRLSGIKEHDGEYLDRIVTNLIEDVNIQYMNNINHMHRVATQNRRKHAKFITAGLAVTWLKEETS